MQTFAVMCLCLFAPGAFAADGDASAVQLYEEAMTLYQQGEYEQALNLFEQVDVVQLNKDQRESLYDAKDDAQRQLSAQVSPGDLIKQADAAAKAGNASLAASLYGRVIAHDASTDAQVQTATARLAEVQRQSNAEADALRRMIADADADLKAGRLDAAEVKLEHVQASGVDLGWWDNRHVEQQLDVIAARRDQMGELAVALDDNGAGAPPANGDAADADAEAESPPPAQGSDTIVQARQLLAQRAVVDARAAEQQRNYALASRHFREALALDPNNADAQAGVERVEAKLVGGAVGAGPLENELGMLEIRIQAVQSKVNEQLAHARTEADARRFTAARDAVQQARALLDQNRHDLPRVMYDDLKGQADALAARIGEAQASAQQQEQEQIDANRQADAQRSRLEAERAEYEQVQELLRRALGFQREQKYDRALELLDQALFHDPNNIAAQGLREAVAQAHRTQKFNALLTERNTMIGDHSIDNTDATRPFVPVLNYPPDWPEISRRRLQGLTVTTEEGRLNEEISERLRTRIDVQFDGNDLESVLNYIRDVTGVNMFVNWQALQGEGVEPDTPINLRLDNIPADQILRIVLRQASADAEFNPVVYSVVEGIVTISTQRDLTRTTMTRMYDIRDLLVNVPNFDEAPDFDLSSVLDSGGGGGGAGGGGGGGGESLFGGDTGDTDDDQPDRGQRIQDIINLITDTIGRTEEWDVYGGDVSSIKELNGSLIIKTTTDNHGGVLDLLSQLRETRAMQISVEARFLLVDQNFLNDVGVDVDLFVEDPGGNFGPISIAQDTFGLAVRQNTGLPGSFGVGSSDPVGDFNETTGFPGSGRSLDVQFSYLDDIQVAVMIRATRANRRAVSLSAPRLTFMNGQKAFVIVARQIAFVSELEPVPEASGFNPTLDVVNSGVVLIVEGTISADRRYVTLTLEPSLATVATPIRTIPQVAADPNAEDDQAPADDDDDEGTITAFIEAPEVELTQVKTTVNVPDKGTIMIGGQRLVGEIELEVGVPVLSKLPFVNRLFTNRSEVKDERTLLILVKPQIIIQSEEEDILFPGLNQELGQ